jgi:hypothetical protein
MSGAFIQNCWGGGFLAKIFVERHPTKWWYKIRQFFYIIKKDTPHTVLFPYCIILLYIRNQDPTKRVL